MFKFLTIVTVLVFQNVECGYYPVGMGMGGGGNLISAGKMAGGGAGMMGAGGMGTAMMGAGGVGAGMMGAGAIEPGMMGAGGMSTGMMGAGGRVLV
ncbi:hypothetical protein JTB14_024311 [Gonioctena quinquepunctata]|nr:hypothetical protein JTB14_024311 [Gonioctena quinquepunctata]